MDAAAKPIDWHSKSLADVATELGSALTGLSTAEARSRLATLGPNEVSHRRPPSPLALFIEQFKSALIVILLAAAGVSALVGERTDALVIVGVVVFNAFIGLWQERKAGEAMTRLQSLTPSIVHVMRDSVERTLPAAEVVPGDLLLLETGTVVAADGRLVEAVNLKINEAVFTGESVPTEKGSQPLIQSTPLLERTNLAWRGTTVVGGRGRLLVTATGARTRLGEIVATVANEPRTSSPFQRQLGRFSTRLTLLIIGLGLLVFALGVARHLPVEQTLLLAVSLVVSLIPEGLPVVITLTLAWAMWQMAKRRALLRKLTAVEALGAITTIAADKTGTLTYGQMMVEEVFSHDRVLTVSGHGYDASGDFLHAGQTIEPLADPDVALALQVGALCNDARFVVNEAGSREGFGDPTELALLTGAAKAGLHPEALAETLPRVGEFPFDFQTRLMVTIHRQADGRQFVALKGAPRAVLDLCGRVSHDGQAVALTTDERQRVDREYELMAAKALRGLALAYAIIDPDHRLSGAQELKDQYIFVGLFGLRDPIRAEATPAVREAQAAGIRVLMLTGDYRVTAQAVAREIGLLDASSTDAFIDGAEMAELSDAALSKRLATLRVASRVSPEDKHRIARLLKARGEVVAMTGDGINDVPALAAADVGVAIGATATDAAKEAADMIVTDGNLSSILTAVGEGRTIIRNIRRVLVYLLASNFAELVLILLALLAGLPLPLLPTQIIWLNAVTDPFMGLALAREPRPATVMAEPPRPAHEPILGLAHWLRIGLLALTVGLATFVLFLARGGDADPRRVFGVTLTAMALGEWIMAFTVRSSRRSLFAMFSTNRSMWPAFALVIALQVAILYIPALAQVFHVTALTFVDWLVVVAAALPVLLVDEFRKVLVRRRLAV